MNNLSQPMQLETSPLEGTAMPFAAFTITVTKQAYIDLNWQINYWQAQHAKACKREQILKDELQQKEAMIRDLKQRLFGRKSEKGASNPGHEINPNAPTTTNPKRPRGQQKGAAGHGRTTHATLPIVEEIIPLNDSACAQCGKAYSLLPDEESVIIEVEVQAYTRRIKRRQCATHCACDPKVKIITAPIPPKLIPKSPYGSSIWEHILLNKFLYGQPINRISNDLESLGLCIATGTIAGGLKKLTPLFSPIYEAFHARQMTETKFHSDETRWEVYEQIAGKVGHRWYLWVTRSMSAVYYCIDPTRSAAVPLAHFSNVLSKSIIIICDRYSAYKKLAKLNMAIILAFCWVHVRRDFLELSRSHIDLTDWSLDWVNEIGNLFHLNKERMLCWDSGLSLTQQSSLFQEKHNTLGSALIEMKLRCDNLLEADKLAAYNKEKIHPRLQKVQRKVLTSLKKHWKGLCVFYEHPEVNMDNNLAEQSIRNPVIGRKNYYGSGSQWSAELTAMIFSIFQTMLLWQLNPRTWLNLYLEACAKNRGNPPQNLSEFLPWMMSEAQLKKLKKPPDKIPS